MPPNRLLALAAVLALVVVAPASSLALAPTAPADAGGSATLDRAPADRGSSTAGLPAGPAISDGGPSDSDGGPSDSDGESGAADSGSSDANRSAEPSALGFTTAGYALRSVVETEENTTNYLEIPNREVEGEGYSRVSSNVVGAIERDVAEIRSNYSRRSFELTHADATEAGTVAGIRTEVERLEARIGELTRRQQRAIDRYNDGTWTTERFLRELSTIDATARGIEDRFEHLENSVILPLPTNLRTKMQALKMELVSLRGPVRDSVGDALSGERDPLVVYSVTSANGVITAHTGDQLFYREAFLGENRARTGANLFVSEDDPRGFSAADQRAKELYPWAYAYGGGGVDTFVNTTIYEVALDNPHGTLDVYLDGRTTEAYREIQRKGLALLPTDPRGNVSNGLSLQVNRTHGTGPVEVVVTEDTGEPLNATVTVNGYEVGTTGADGRLWAVSPHQEVRIEVETADGRTVTLSYFAD